MIPHARHFLKIGALPGKVEVDLSLYFVKLRSTRLKCETVALQNFHFDTLLGKVEVEQTFRRYPSPSEN